MSVIKPFALFEIWKDKTASNLGLKLHAQQIMTKAKQAVMLSPEEIKILEIYNKQQKVKRTAKSIQK